MVHFESTTRRGRLRRVSLRPQVIARHEDAERVRRPTRTRMRRIGEEVQEKAPTGLERLQMQRNARDTKLRRGLAHAKDPGSPKPQAQARQSLAAAAVLLHDQAAKHHGGGVRLRK